MENDDANFGRLRSLIAAAIDACSSYVAPVGSGEAEDVRCALDCLGMAYAALSDDYMPEMPEEDD